jgi:hypothetical protein
MMAKTTNRSGLDKVTPAKPAERAAQEIRRFHGLGRRVLDKARAEGITADAAVQDLVDTEGVSLDGARKAARFAALFDDRALDRVCSLCLAGQRPLSVNHVRRVLRLKRPVDRLRWLELAAKGGWTAIRLDLAMKRDAATNGGAGGPRIKKPADLLDALHQVVVQSGEWLKRYDAIWEKDEVWPPIIGLGSTDLEASRERLKEAKGLLKRLRDGATSLEERLTKIDHGLKKKPGPAGLKRSPGDE